MEIESLAQQFYSYSLYMRGYSKATVLRYTTIIKMYLRHAGITNIEEVTEKNIREFFMYGRTVRGWLPSTFISFQQTLIVFFRWCQQEGVMKDNPAVCLEAPKLIKRIPPKLTRQEAFRLLEVVYNYPYISPFLRERNHAIFSIFVFAGLRKSELLHLKYTDVDIENMTIFVRQGKGNKDRIIPMSFTLAQTLRKYIEERKRIKRTCPEFFASLTRDKPLSNEGLMLLVRIIRQASRIQFSAHKLRHTFATLMLEGGCDIYSLSRMMGHSDIKTTTIYLAASAEHLRSQMIKHPLNELSMDKSIT